MKQLYPILEFDPAQEAVIEPGRVVKPRGAPERCVICFFKEVVEEARKERKARRAACSQWEDGPHPLYEMIFQGVRLAFMHPGVGGSMAAGLLEEAIAAGCRKFIVCGGCGVLEKGLAVGRLVVATAAVRDEGVSYHYLPPGREVEAGREGIAALESVLQAHGLPYLKGKTWTTDAPYRETRAKVNLRRSEGCLTVEMEAASLLAVAAFRNVVLGQVLYSGDDLSGENWDQRQWHTRTDIRRSLFWLAAEACLRL